MTKYDSHSNQQLLDLLTKLESVDPQDKNKMRSEIRKELFKRNVSNINGIPLDVILRNPLLRKEYEEAIGGK